MSSLLKLVRRENSINGYCYCALLQESLTRRFITTDQHNGAWFVRRHGDKKVMVHNHELLVAAIEQAAGGSRGSSANSLPA